MWAHTRLAEPAAQRGREDVKDLLRPQGLYLLRRTTDPEGEHVLETRLGLFPKAKGQLRKLGVSSG